MALIPLELTADDHIIHGESGIICFHTEQKHTSRVKTISWYPIVNTIIREVVANPDYKTPRDRDE